MSQLKALLAVFLVLLLNVAQVGLSRNDCETRRFEIATATCTVSMQAQLAQRPRPLKSPAPCLSMYLVLKLDVHCFNAIGWQLFHQGCFFVD